MINVSLTENGSIKMTCVRCGYSTVIDVSWAKSPFWDIFVGQAILMMLGHMEKEHS